MPSSAATSPGPSLAAALLDAFAFSEIAVVDGCKNLTPVCETEHNSRNSSAGDFAHTAQCEIAYRIRKRVHGPFRHAALTTEHRQLPRPELCRRHPQLIAAVANASQLRRARQKNWCVDITNLRWHLTARTGTDGDASPPFLGGHQYFRAQPVLGWLHCTRHTISSNDYDPPQYHHRDAPSATR